MVVVPSILDAVTVHAEGALCTRLASVPAHEGRLPTQVRIEGLPLGMRPGSLRASVRQGPAGLVVRDIRPLFDVRLPPETDLPAAQHALEEAQEQLTRLAAELERVQRELQSLQKLRPAFPPRKKDEPMEPREASLSAILSLADFVDTQLASLHARRLELERQHREAAEEVELRRRRLEEGSSAVRGERAQLYRAAVLTLSEAGPAEGEARLALEYAVRGARWVPGYDLRMTRTLEEGTLRLRAFVLQRTGEDWSQVRLSLSTADLERRAEVPELKALRIGRKQPPPVRSGWREPPPGLDELFAGYDALQVPPPPPRPQPLPVKRERSEAREFEMPTRIVPAVQAASSGAVPPPPPPSMAAAPSLALPSPRSRGGPKGGAPPSAPRVTNEMSRRQLEDFRLEDQPAKKRASLREAEEAAPEFDTEAAEGEMPYLGDGGASFGGRQEEPAGLEPAGDLLDYGNLELGATHQPGLRGRLQPRPEYLSPELLALAAVHVQVDVIALVARYERAADSVRQVPLPACAVPPRQSTPHFDYRFDVETRAEVPSDGTWHTVPVFSAPVGLAAEYVCVPSVEPLVFRTVKVENRTPHALLAGPVDVTLGDEFLMTSPLPTLAPGATQRLGLGVEESLKVSRNTRFDEASGGMFGGASVLTHHVTIELANRTPQRVTVEVRERVPVVPSSEKDIKVEEGEVLPPWHRRTPLPGEVPLEGERAWRVVAGPGETRTLKATWLVRIPSSKLLVGGNRRT
jgi:hypothetical protein